MMEMTKKEVTALADYVRWVADAVGLKDWQFDVVVTDESNMPDGALAADEEFQVLGSCKPTPGQHQAVIRFAHDFRDLPKEQQREIVVHELLHCHLADLFEHGRTGLLDQLTRQTYEVFMFGFAQSWEHAVDSMARAWATKMPMIKWPAKKRKRRR